DDQQDAVSADHARLVDLVGVDDEVLAQHRQGAGVAGFAQEAVAALEKINIGEDRQARRAARLIAAGNRGRVEILADQALGRAGLFHLGTARRFPGSMFAADGIDEAPCRRLVGGARAHAVERPDLAALADFLVLARQDGGEDIAHVAASSRVIATNSSNLARAAPDAIASRDKPMPSPMVSATPATYNAAPAFK